MKTLPHVADITRKYCHHFCGILLVDGKFVKVKGFERKIPVIYGVDYLTHDIPTYKFAPSENYQACLSFFQSLRLLNYPLQAVVCDDNENIREACLAVYPKAIVQTCQNHFKENIRASLGVRTDPTYQPFMREIEELFATKRALADFDYRARRIVLRYQHWPLCVAIMLDIQRKKNLLLGYHGLKNVPTTTNLIESLNSHLEGRLKTIKGFESFKHADLWLNGYFLRRRFLKYTDCEGKFKHLNGKTSFGESSKCDLDLTRFF